MKRFTVLVFTIMSGNITFARSAKDTIPVFFKLNQEKLYKPAQAMLDSLLYNDIVNSSTSILIIGYADYLGNEDDNLGLSERRAKTVQEYLTKMNVPAKNIKLCIGKGEVNRAIKSVDGYAPDRRVDVVIDHIHTSKTTGTQKRSGQLPANKTSTIITNMKVGETLRLENIYFLLGRHIVTDESFPQLDKLYEALEDNDNIKIQIEGHVCCLTTGFDADDEDTHETRLSVNRARFIYDYLIKKGIDKNRLRYVGFGRSRPLISPERTIGDEDKNRRVEIRVIEK